MRSREAKQTSKATQLFGGSPELKPKAVRGQNKSFSSELGSLHEPGEKELGADISQLCFPIQVALSGPWGNRQRRVQGTSAAQEPEVLRCVCSRLVLKGTRIHSASGTGSCHSSRPFPRHSQFHSH